MLENVAEQLKLHKSAETSNSFFDTVIFCTNVTYADGQFKGGESISSQRLSSPRRFLTLLPIVDLTSRVVATADTNPVKTQSELAAAWKSLIQDFPAENVHVLPSIEHAIRAVREIEPEGGADILVVGSLHLVGGVIEVAGLSEVAL